MKTAWTIENEEELARYGDKLLTLLKTHQSTEQATILTLTGTLGAGKTTLTQELARALGVTGPVRSPTFVISKHYDLTDQAWDTLVHIDAYRLEDEPLEALGFEAMLNDPSNLVVIEWPEYISPVLPTKQIALAITIEQDESRLVDIYINN